MKAIALAAIFLLPMTSTVPAKVVFACSAFEKLPDEKWRAVKSSPIVVENTERRTRDTYFIPAGMRLQPDIPSRPARNTDGTTIFEKIGGNVDLVGELNRQCR